MSKKKTKAKKAYAFIDTNIFLDFYRSQNETSLSLLRKLESVKHKVICTYQVEMEFLKNRQTAIIDNSTESGLSIDDKLPAVLGDSKLQSILKKQRKEIKKSKVELQKKITNIISNPTLHDPVYKSLEAIFSSEDSHVLTRDMNIRHKIKRLAWRRFMLGYPPRKNKDTSVGDALNWEWFIHCSNKLTGKFIIVSRDKDYGTEYNGQTFLNDALKSEFQDRVGRKPIIYTTKLSEALKHLEISVTTAEVESENAQINSLSSYSTDIQGDVSASFIKLPRLVDTLGKAKFNLTSFDTSGIGAMLKNINAKQKMFEDTLQNISKTNWKSLGKDLGQT